MTSVFSWQNSVSLALLHSVLQGQICLLLQVSLDFLLLHSSPYDEKDIFSGVFVLEGLVGLHRYSTSASSALVVGAQTWVTVMLNGLPWK